MSQELEALNGKLHGLTAAISVIAAALPQSSALDVQETLRDLLGETASADLPRATLESMHTVIRHVIDSMEIGLRH